MGRVLADLVEQAPPTGIFSRYPTRIFGSEKGETPREFFEETAHETTTPYGRKLRILPDGTMVEEDPKETEV